MIAVSYIMKRKIKKIFFEVISNSKIFNIIFFNEMVNDQDFPKLTGGLDSVEYGISLVCLKHQNLIDWRANDYSITWIQIIESVVQKVWRRYNILLSSFLFSFLHFQLKLITLIYTNKYINKLKILN